MKITGSVKQKRRTILKRTWKEEDRSPEWEQELIHALKDESSGVRFAAVLALWHIVSNTASTPVSELLYDADPRVRGLAAMVLSYIGDVRAVPALIRRLDTPAIGLKATVILALGRIGSRESAPYIIPFLDADDWRLRWDSAVALARLHDARAVRPLWALRADPDVPLSFRRRAPLFLHMIPGVTSALSARSMRARQIERRPPFYSRRRPPHWAATTEYWKEQDRHYPIDDRLDF